MAEKRWPHLVGDKVLKGQLFRRIEKRDGPMTEEESKAVMAMLDSAESFAKLGMTEIGTSGDGAVATAWDEINKRADKLVSEDPKLTKAQAVDKVMQADPELYRKYREEDRQSA